MTPLLNNERDISAAVLHLIAITALILFVLFFVMEDIERLKRITRPHLIFVGTAQKETAGAEAPAAIEGEISRSETIN